MAYKDKAVSAAYHKEYYKRWAEANKERKAAYNTCYKQANKEKVAAAEKRYREKHKEAAYARKRHWYELNRVTQLAYMKEYNRQWYLSHEYDPVKQHEKYIRGEIRFATRQFEEAKAWTEAHPEAMARCPL